MFQRKKNNNVWYIIERKGICKTCIFPALGLKACFSHIEWRSGLGKIQNDVKIAFIDDTWGILLHWDHSELKWSTWDNFGLETFKFNESKATQVNKFNIKCICSIQLEFH